MSTDPVEHTLEDTVEETLERTYDADFYDSLADEVRASAEVIVPLVVDLLRPARVLDVGCGRGTWLNVFRANGVTTIVGVDGPHVSESDLEIPRSSFITHDLRSPVALDETFDLVVSLEVGEHLDEALARDYVTSLVTHAPAVLFSAAIPYQGGAGHVNEQWQSYWREMFDSNGFAPLDVIRPAVWNDSRVAFWYAQNTVLYVDREAHAALLRAHTPEAPDGPHETQPFDLVHPQLHARDHGKAKQPSPPPSLSRVLRDVPGAASRAFRGRVGRVVPPSRRVKGLGGAKGRRRLQLRKLIAPVLQRTVTLTSHDGLRLRVTPDPVDEQIAHHLLGSGRSEYFPEWPTPPPGSPCILDVGAHHGLYAAAALHEHPRGRIICVEPSAEAIVSLRANLAVNDFSSRARIVRAGLAAERGEGTLRHTAEGTWGASLYEEDAVTTSTEAVPLATLEEILGDDRPDIVKCNAEGAEYTLIDQLAASTLRPAFMLVMVHPEFGDMERLLGQAAGMGYRTIRVGTADHPAFQMWRDGGTA
jgi:FkbM family methyltransferase